MVDGTHACVKNIGPSNFAFPQELEYLSKVRELPGIKGGFDEAAGEEFICFFSVGAVADVGSPGWRSGIPRKNSPNSSCS